MTKALEWTGRAIPFLLPLILIIFLVMIAKTFFLQANANELSSAITLDMLLTVPFIYFLLIRKREVPKITVVPVFILGIIICSLILPADNRFLLDLAKMWMLPVVEVAILGFVLIKIRKTAALFKKENDIAPDFYSALRKASAEIFPTKLASIFSMEISVIYYSFFVWKRRKLVANEFTYHKESSIRILLGVFIFIILVETAVIHILLQEWSVVAAWFLTGLSVYTAFQLFAILKSVSRRPICICEKKLILRHGLLSETEIPIEQIRSIELTSKSIEANKSNRLLSPLGEMDGHNVVIELTVDQELLGFYGIKKSFRKIAFHVDEKQRFFEALEERLTKFKK
ncbi:MAG: hypothetical protein ABJG78_08300 [Cyclobacteriaceae bacterium]